MAASKKLPAHLVQYRHAIVAIDTVIFAMRQGRLVGLLLQISRDPFKGKWALPGGLILPEENLEESVERHLLNKTGIKKVYLEQLKTFADVKRDPRGRVVSVAHLVLLSDADIKLKKAAEYSDMQWFDIDQLPALAYDHKDIIASALKRLKAKLGYTNIAQYLLPARFTLSDLQRVYEAVLGHALDKRNFRKKLLALDIIKETSEKSTGAFRPAQLYSFKEKKLQIIEIL